MGVTGPDLPSIDPPATIGHFRSRLERKQVRTRIGFTHPYTEITLAGNDSGEDRLAHRVMAIADQNRAALAIGDPVRPDRRTHCQHFLSDHKSLQKRSLLPTISARPRHADKSGLTTAATEFRRVRGHAEASRFKMSSRDFFVQKVADLYPHCFGLVRQLHRVEVNCFWHL